MSASRKFVVCSLAGLSFALELSKVERVARVVEITPVPEAPPSLLGIIKVKDRVVPVVNTRRRFGLPERGIELSDEMIIARVSHGPVALLVDAVTGLMECNEEAVVAAGTISPDLEAIDGVAKTADGLMIIEDLERVLSSEEAGRLYDALAMTS